MSEMLQFHVYPDELEEDDILFRNELLAYRRLSAQGLCDKGVVCQFYGCMAGLDPALNESWLRPFVNDAFRPCAIFLEYIPNLLQINSETYTKERWQRATEVQNDILRAGVLQQDIHYNAMVAVDGNSEDRVIWLDFDWAKTYDQDIRETPDAVYQIDQMRKMGLGFVRALGPFLHCISARRLT